MKDLHDAILNLRPVPTINGPRDAYAWAGGYETARRDAAVLVAEYRQKLGRPWKATEEDLVAHGEAADFAEWEVWMRAQGINPLESGTYAVACAVADAMCPPPSPLANVLYDLIDDCFEKGRTPTPEEIEPFLMPKVKALVWRWVQYRAAWIATVGEDSDHEYWVQGEDGRFRWTCMTLGAGNAHGHCPTLELAQAAAQDHWERRAMEFYKEAFE